MYDYIIVGAGSAGCVLANRLSADNVARVLLIEAGGPDSAREIHVPITFSKLFKTGADWAFYTEEQRRLNNRKLYWPRGKVLGGSSSINAMIYIRGNRRDYDRWAQMGATGWDWNGVERFFEQSLTNVAGLRCVNPISEAFVEAATQAGYARNHDFNGAMQEGFGVYRVTQLNGRRHSAADAYLRPAMRRKNLAVHTGALATGIVMEGAHARGVRYVRNGKTETARAEREVVLAGGAVNSPQLLLLSGIGPADQLKRLGIKVAVDLPGVGENLQDHPIVPICYRSRVPVSLANATRITNLARYLARRRGPLTSNVAEAGGFVHTRVGLDRPDLQFHFAPGFFLDHGFRTVEGHGFSFGPTLLRPESRGWIRLRSADPADHPLIQPNYLEAEADLQVLVDGIKMAREIARGKAFDPFRGEEMFFGKSGDLAEYVRAMLETLYHPVGTCKMGTDPMAVVDPHLRVRGVVGLRVVDASVMPEVISGNTNAPTMMVAERGAAAIMSA